MKPWQLVLVVLGVVGFHAVLFWLIADPSPLPEGRIVPPPTFVAREGRGVDEETGEPFIYREFRVSTKLALPDVLMEARAEPSPTPSFLLLP